MREMKSRCRVVFPCIFFFPSILRHTRPDALLLGVGAGQPWPGSTRGSGQKIPDPTRPGSDFSTPRPPLPATQSNHHHHAPSKSSNHFFSTHFPLKKVTQTHATSFATHKFVFEHTPSIYLFSFLGVLKILVLFLDFFDVVRKYFWHVASPTLALWDWSRGSGCCLWLFFFLIISCLARQTRIQARADLESSVDSIVVPLGTNFDFLDASIQYIGIFFLVKNKQDSPKSLG